MNEPFPYLSPASRCCLLGVKAYWHTPCRCVGFEASFPEEHMSHRNVHDDELIFKTMCGVLSLRKEVLDSDYAPMTHSWT